MKNSLYLLSLFPVFFVFLLIACKGQADLNTIQIITGDFYFKPETIQLNANHEVKIELVNKGNIEHEFMVGRGVEETEDNDKIHEEMNETGEKAHDTSEAGNEHQKRMDGANAKMSRGFDKDFFEGIEVNAETENGAEFVRVPGHGTMVALKPGSKATLTFKVPLERKGLWEMACFVPGHYEAKMSGRIIVK